MVEYELKRYVEAIRYLQDALASTERPLTEEQRAQTEKLLEKAGGYVARYRFALTPADAKVSIDGAPWSGDPRRGLLLAAGEHVLEVTAANHQVARRTVQVLGGEGDRELAVVLLEERAQREPTASSAPPVDQGSRRARKAWIWGTVGAVLIGGAAVGLVLGLRSKHGDAQVNKGTTGLEIPVPRGMALEWR